MLDFTAPTRGALYMTQRMCAISNISADLFQWAGHASLLWELHEQELSKLTNNRREKERQQAHSLALLTKQLSEERERGSAAASQEREAATAQLRAAQEVSRTTNLKPLLRLKSHSHCLAPHVLVSKIQESKQPRTSEQSPEVDNPRLAQWQATRVHCGINICDSTFSVAAAKKNAASGRQRYVHHACQFCCDP